MFSWALFIGLLIVVLGSILSGPVLPQVSYSTFFEQLRQDNIATVTLEGERIEAIAKTPVSYMAGAETYRSTQFETFIPVTGDEALMPLLRQQQVDVITRPGTGGGLGSTLLFLLPILLLGGFVLYLFTRSRMQSDGQSMFSVGKSKAKAYKHDEDLKTTFADVAGTEGAKRELQETVAFLKNPNTFQYLGGKMPKGMLLVGPPGTGKTLLARAVAGEAGVPFFSTSGSDFMEMFVGVGAARVRDMFTEAKKQAPCIIFIDELDSVGRQRGVSVGGGNEEREQTLNQLLTEMDGFEANDSVIVMAATNRPDILDKALLRPGRFDRQITVGLPNKQGRLKILEVHARNKPLAEDVDLEELARGTPSFCGADLENLLNEAALTAARKYKQAIEREDIDEARDRVLLGRLREGMSLTKEDCDLIAYHEAGHAVLAATLPHADPLQKVTIIPRGRAMGVTQQLPAGEKYIYRKEYLLDRLAVMMGGRAAEDLFLQTATSGAANDFKQATGLARKMVLELGMSERIGTISLAGGPQETFLESGKEYSEVTAREIDEETRRLVTEAYARAKQTLEAHRDGVERLVQALLDEEEVSGQQVLALLDVQLETPLPEAVRQPRQQRPQLEPRLGGD